MSEAGSWNARIVEEFRANNGQVGGAFEGAPLVLLHHRGRTSGKDYIAPVMYLAGEQGRMYVFASKAGAPDNPDWYYNLTAARAATAELGTETVELRVTEIEGDERARVFAQQVERYPGFGEYEAKTRGIRVIPVLALDRAG
ncbi:MAG: nitroreductase family deazaflavin-dependent oxidoreductase [Actinomycetota bacterium]|nr:nitroreductase family deazaflavin-dependent oxidoreductase [Actinomycetota bacterium]